MGDKKLDAKTARAFIDKARDLYEVEGEIEVDDTPENDSDALAMLSPAGDKLADIRENGGCYVRAWVWVPIEEVES